ncbi:MAG: hypothetical protein JNK28_09520 [Burkholderiaceae bacterium]|nr:hypothetical protein [Burkholderiaceae bacterium]
MTADDDCYFFGEYQSRAGYAASPTNGLITNFKKPVTRRGLAEYRYKEQSIVEVGQLIRTSIAPAALRTSTFVPIPPSRSKGDPLYDDRLVRALGSGDLQLDVREVLVKTQSTRAHHEYADGERRPTPDELYELLALDETQLLHPLRPLIILFDDVLTNGTHFKACKRRLVERVPDAKVIGLFIGRRKALTRAEFDLSAFLADL